MGHGVVPPSVKREVDEEFSFHVEMRVHELVAEGWDERDARLEALRRFGDIERVKADCRALGMRRDVRMSWRLWQDELRQDVGYTLRQLRRAPGFALITLLTLAIGIGANTAVFSVVNAVALRPLPFPEPDRLAVVWSRYLPESGFDIDKFVVSDPEWLDYREETRAFQSVGAYFATTRALTGEGLDATRVRVASVSADVLPTLGVRPALGRWITADEDVPSGPAVVVLGHGVWTERYGADPTLVGRTVPMNGVAHEVVGVMPAGFDFPSGSAAWLPLGIDRANAGNRAGHGLSLVARLADRQDLTDAHAELAVLRERWAAEHQHNRGHFLWTQSLKAEVVADAPRMLAILMAAVGLVLLIACANVANLLLARGERRFGEVAVRAVLGGGRGRITRQLATESVVMAVLAAALGLAMAWGGVAALSAAYPTALPRMDEIGIDGTVLGFTLGVATVTALLFGLAPAFLAGRRAAAWAAGSAGRSVGGRRATLLRRLLVSGEVAVSLVVVILAGLMVQTFSALTGSDPRLDADGLLAFSVTLPSTAYPQEDRVSAEYESLLERVRAIPGVRGAAAATYLPFSGRRSQWDFQLDDRPPRQDGDVAWNAGVTSVTHGYFEALGIPILDGRAITPQDGPDAPMVAVVSESMATRYWPGERVVGKRFGYTVAQDSVPWMTIVGIVPDPVSNRVDEDAYPHVYIPHAQIGVSGYGVPRTMTVATRTGVDPVGLTSAVRAVVGEFDPDLPLYQVTTMEAMIVDSLADTRITADLLGAFALIALVLAVVGVYGVIAYSVAGRTREIGVRVALGAPRRAITHMVVSEGARPVLVGIVLGLAAAWYASRWIAAMLYGVAPTDGLTFAVLPAALLAVGVLASWLPALRAARVHPTEALRET